MSRHAIRRRLAVGAVPLVSAALVVGSASAAAATVTGPDVASYQHPSGRSINWASVYTAGKRFVFVKATEGTRYRNPYFTRDWSGSHAAGLVHGAYHFARPSTRAGSAAAQARTFVATVGRSRSAGDLPPSLDLEVSGGLRPAKLIRWTRQWLNTVQNLTGRKPMIYSYPSFWSHNMARTTTFRGYRLWGASYGRRPTTFGGAWSKWTFWQYSSSTRLSGIHAKTDMNKFNGSLAQLRSLAYMRSSSTSAPVTTTKAATHLSIHTPDSATAWQQFDVTGRLMVNDHGVAGKQLHLHGRLVGSDQWIDLPGVATGAAGRWKVTVRAPDDAQIKASFAGTSRLAASRSRIATVTLDSSSSYSHH